MRTMDAENMQKIVLGRIVLIGCSNGHDVKEKCRFHSGLML